MISLIVAYDENRVIGYENQLPWHLPNDLQHFKHLTTGKTIVMGRATFESIGKALPNRKNIVLTNSTTFQAENVEVVHRIDDILQLEAPMIIGGASIYQQLLPYTDHLYITVIHHKFKGDTYFPGWDSSKFQLVSAEDGLTNEKNKYPHTFYHYQKNRE
jgi:dihydrofolate reductase